MRRNRILILVLLPLLLLPLLSSCDSTLNPSVLAAETQNTVTDTREYSATVFDEVQHNLDLVAGLKEKLNKSDKPPTLSEVIDSIESVAKSYESLSSRKEEIKQDFNKRIVAVKDMQEQVQTEATTLNGRIAYYNRQIIELPSTTSDPEILRTRKKALEQAIGFVDAQLKIWAKFYQLEDYITSEMQNIGRQIEDFLSLVESSAIVFREGLNVLKLQQNVNDALALFNVDLPKIQQLTNGMEKSWGDLDSLINALVLLPNDIKTSPTNIN